MKTARLTLRKRIIIAVAAIAVIHTVFYVVPRLWLTRLHVDEEAYLDAVEVLTREFGPAAVEKGVVRIPRCALSVPWSGTLLAASRFWPEQMWLHMGARECFVVRAAYRGASAADMYASARARKRPVDVNVVQVSRRDARRIWARFEYLDRAEVAYGVPLKIECTEYRPCLSRVDTTWPFASAVERDEAKETGDWYVTRSVREMLRAREMGRIAGMRGHHWPGDAEVARLAIRSLMTKALPPRCQTDKQCVIALLPPYVRMEGAEALPLVEEIERLKVPSRTGQRMLRIPFLQGLWKALAAPEWPDGPDTSGERWLIKTLDGKTDAERMKVLEAEAFDAPGTSLQQAARARAYLAENRPEEWRALVMRHSDALSFGDQYEFARAGMAPEGWGTSGRSAEELRWRSPADWARISLIIGDRRDVEMLRGSIFEKLDERYTRIGMELGALSAICEASPEEADASVEFVREALSRGGGGSEAQSRRSLATHLLRIGALSPRYASQLCEACFDRPETALGGFAEGDYIRALRSTAGDFARRADADAAMAMRRFYERAGRKADEDAAATGGSPILLRAVLAAEIRNARDAKAFLLALPPEESRQVFSDALWSRFSREEMKELVTDDRLAVMRKRIIEALADLRHAED
jgi:hypothetical protein